MSSNSDNAIFESTFNGYFWLSLAGILTGLLHLSFRYCERSQCKSYNLCNCLKVEREQEDINRTLNRAKSLSTI